jgi:hypothetical protein
MGSNNLDIKEMVLGDVDWIHPARDKGPVASPYEHGTETSEFHKRPDIS